MGRALEGHQTSFYARVAVEEALGIDYLVFGSPPTSDWTCFASSRSLGALLGFVGLLRFTVLL